MDKAQKMRWTVLGLALAVTLIAIAYPVEVPIEQVEEGPIRIPVKADLKPTETIRAGSSPDWVALDDDPFAAQTWAPPVAPPTITAPIARTVEPIDVSAPPPPPSLPFQFIGQMDTGAEHIVYLGRGDQIQMAKVGETLDSTYKLVNVSKSQLDFEIVATGQRQSLPIPASESQ